MKKQNIYKGFLDYQSEFDHRWACWANNHNGWAKLKKMNRRLAKRKIAREAQRDIQNEQYDIDMLLHN